ncbi:MAG: hypothetical protein RR893_14260, partial [Clostridia bacterium]
RLRRVRRARRFALASGASCEALCACGGCVGREAIRKKGGLREAAWRLAGADQTPWAVDTRWEAAHLKYFRKWRFELFLKQSYNCDKQSEDRQNNHD